MYLYKFMPVSNHKNRISWIRKLIIDDEIFIPNVKKLNDPFKLAIQWQRPEQAKNNTAALYLLFQYENLVERTGVLSFSQNFYNILNSTLHLRIAKTFKENLQGCGYFGYKH